MQYESTTIRSPRAIDLTGQTFGRLTVLAFAGTRKQHLYWTCRCACGVEKDINGTGLHDGKVVSCGCAKRERMQNPLTHPKPRPELLHQTFGRWTVIAFADVRQGNAYWTCRCACGAVRDIATHALQNGKSQSCGCAKPELSRQLHTTHGMSSSVEHALRRNMIQRCTNPNHQDYPSYGGRGITVCEAWRTSFEAFYADMGPRPFPQAQLERLDNNQGYGPGNTVWSTPAAQARNRRSTVWLTHEGITLCISDWAHRAGMKPHTLAKRLRDGWSVADALTIPVSKKNTHLHSS